MREFYGGFCDLRYNGFTFFLCACENRLFVQADCFEYAFRQNLCPCRAIGFLQLFHIVITIHAQEQFGFFRFVDTGEAVSNVDIVHIYVISAGLDKRIGERIELGTVLIGIVIGAEPIVIGEGRDDGVNIHV